MWSEKTVNTCVFAHKLTSKCRVTFVNAWSLYWCKHLPQEFGNKKNPIPHWTLRYRNGRHWTRWWEVTVTGMLDLEFIWLALWPSLLFLHLPKPRTMQSSLPLPFISISPWISQQILTGLPSRSVTTSPASIIVQRMAILTGKLPNVSSVCYQHSNQRDTVKMCIRPSMIYFLRMI